MLMIILSGVVGVLLSKMFEDGKENKHIFFTLIVLILLAVIFHLLGKTNPTLLVYEKLSGFYNGVEKNIILQIILITGTYLGINWLDKRKTGILPFEKYSEKIKEFTKNARVNSVIRIAAGDMDFFGGVKVDEIDIPQLMDNSEEYKQLFDLKQKLNGLKIDILCSHGLEKESKLLNSIYHGTINPEILYSQFQKKERLNDATFQQLLRIGRMKTDFRGFIDIRFYNDKNKDKEFRARFIDDAGIVYRRERKDTRKVLRKKKSFPFFQLQTYAENLYSVNELNSQEYQYYSDMFMLKWESCNVEECEKVISFCESLYRHVTKTKKRFNMALVYVKSYEVARKQERRKEFPPFGVMYLAASVLEMPEWDVELIAVDEKTSNDDLQIWDKYDAIGFSIISSYSYGILKHCCNASKKRKDAVIFAGGYQAERFANDVFTDFDADIIFKGESENSIKSFCENYEDRNYAAIEGIIYRGVDRSIKATSGPLCVDIDKIPFPARDLLPDEDVVMTDRLAGTEIRMVHMLFSRGCKYNCFYCAANQDHRIKEIRYRSKNLIVQELVTLIDTYQIEGFSIIDDCFLTDQKKAIEICEYIASYKLGLKWSLAARVDSINDKVLAALKESGCIEIKFGIETGSDKLLQEMNKGVTVAQAEEAIEKTKKAGINVKVFIITGLPFESDETHEQTKKFLDKMYEKGYIDRISLLRYTPLAGSHIYAQPNNYGVNSSSLNRKNFDKASLYRNSYDWWTDKKRYKDCQRWYEDMSKFIEERWSDI